MNYILISSIKNERNNLLDFYNSVCAQTIKPIVWVIVNDGSTNISKEILDKKFSEQKFIYIIHLEESARSLFNVYNKINIGIEFAINLLKRNNQEWEYLGILDGDIVIPANYYEDLMNKFESDENLGIVSGQILSLYRKRYKMEYREKNKPGNAARLISRKCFN